MCRYYRCRFGVERGRFTRHRAELSIVASGGGARGAESEPEVGDGFTDNWFHTVALTLGLMIR